MEFKTEFIKRTLFDPEERLYTQGRLGYAPLEEVNQAIIA